MAPAPPTPPAVAETANLAEQLRVLKALNPLSLSTEQMQSLLGLLKPGRQKLEQQDQANVRQMAGRQGEAWGAESGTDRLVVVRYAKRKQ